MRTGASLSIYVYGGVAGARFEAERLRELHRKFTGIADGRRYSALNPAAYAWVHATLVMAPVDAQRFFGRPLSTSELDEYYAQMCGVGRILGIRDFPPTWPDFVRYYDEMVAGFSPNETIETLLETASTVGKPFSWLPSSWWPPVRKGQTFLIRATIPAELRTRLGLEWTVADERKFARFQRVVRILGAVTPPPLRTAHMRWIGKLNVWLRAHPWAYRFFVRS